MDKHSEDSAGRNLVRNCIRLHVVSVKGADAARKAGKEPHHARCLVRLGDFSRQSISVSTVATATCVAGEMEAKKRSLTLSNLPSRSW